MRTDTSQWRTRWLSLARRASDRLAEAGLEGFAETFAIVLRPLGPLAANLLWVAEPIVGESVGALAELLADEEAEEKLRVDNSP